MKRKFLSLLLALAMACSLFVPAMAADEETVKPYAIPDVKGKVVILHTNDTHGGDMAEEGKSIGTAGVAQLKKDFEAAGADVILLSAGDATQGAPLVNYSQGGAAIEFMNAAGYDAMAPGNHEFDWGAENLQAIVKDAEFPILAANILGEDGKPFFESNTIFTTKGGLKIGVFGLDTPEAATKTNPEKIKGLTFLAGEELYACAQAQVDELKAAGCTFIIGLGHLGVDEETAATYNRSVDVVNHVTGIDLFVDGHSHTVMEDGKPVSADTYPSFKNESDTLIVSTGTKLAYVGAVIYDPAAKTLSPSLISAAEYSKTDAAVVKLVSDTNASVDEALKKVIGATEVSLNGERAPGNRTEETNLGDFATDALLWFAKKDQGDHVVAAITNGGGIRDTIPAGDISMKTMNTVFPFGNTVVTVTLTGAQLLETLEAATYCTPTPIGAFPQVAGIEFTINTAVPYKNGEPYGTYFRCANPGERVTDVKVAGEPLDLTASYTVATNDFSAVGGDTYYAFKDAKSTMIDTGIPLDEALSQYADEVLGGTISAEKYGEPAGRITINRLPLDMTEGAWYTDAVVSAMEKGVISGTGHGYFTPMGEVTRATMFQLLYNMEGKPETAATIADVAGKWYANAVDWAASAGLFTGNSFGADAVITRAEVAQILADYAAYCGITVDTAGMAMKEAPDYEAIPAEYLEGMTFCYYAGLMTGDQAHRLNPANALTRAELATMLVRFGELEAPLAATVAAVEKYGNIDLDIAPKALLDAGFEYGDVLNVTVGGETLAIPFGTAYSDVDTGSLVVRHSVEGDMIIIAINMGNFSKTYNAAEGDRVFLAMGEKAGYKAEYEAHQVTRTNERADYASDEVFANFRPIVMGDIAEGVLYRTSSPVNPQLGRASYADTLIKEAGIATVVNLADSKEEIDGYIAAEGFASPYYAELYKDGSVIALSMGVDFSDKEFQGKLKEGLEFMLAQEGPYAFHCTEGKDRAGFMAILLEALMGGTKDEIVADYMVSYENYYHVEKDSDQYKVISGIAEGILCQIAGLDKGSDLAKVDLVKAATDYLTGIGMTAEQVASLDTLLSTPVSAQKAA